MENEVVVDSTCHILRYHEFVPVSILHHAVCKQFSSNGAGTVGYRLGKFLLEPLGKAVVAFAGNYGQDIDIMDIPSQHRGILPLTILIYTKSKSSANLLPLPYLGTGGFQGTNLEHVWIVPAFSKSRVGEDEADRGFFRIAIQEQFLVLHDEVVGINVIGGVLFFVRELTVGHATFLVNGKISGMSFMGRDGGEVGLIGFIPELALHRAYDTFVLFLKHIGKNSVVWFPGFIIAFVMVNFVDEEKGQHLDPLVEKLPFSLDVGKNRFPNLDTAKLFFRDFANDIPSVNLDAVNKFHGIIPTVNGLHHKTVLILV